MMVSLVVAMVLASVSIGAVQAEVWTIDGVHWDSGWEAPTTSPVLAAIPVFEVITPAPPPTADDAR